jgi:hypothetical protein
MADTVDTIVVSATKRKYTVRLINVSDATGESAVVKVDLTSAAVKAANGGTIPTYCMLDEIKWDVQGFTSVRLFWNHTTPDEMVVCSGQGAMSYTDVGGLKDPKSSGGNGSVSLTTAGATSGNTYDITLILRLKD